MRHAAIERLLGEARERRCRRGLEGPMAGAGGTEAAAASSQRRPKRSLESETATAAEAEPPSLRAVAAGMRGKVILDAVQRVAMEVAMRQVKRAQAAKPKTSELERMRRECDRWLHILAKVRRLPPYHVRFGNGASATPSDYKYVKGGVPKEVAQLWATEMPRDGAPHRQLGEGNPRDAARRARLSGWNRARGQQPTATLLINSFRKPRRRTPFRRPLGRKMQLCAHNQLLDVAWNADQGRPMDAAMGMRRDATTAQGLWEAERRRT